MIGKVKEVLIMREFDYSFLAGRLWDTEKFFGSVGLFITPTAASDFYISK